MRVGREVLVEIKNPIKANCDTMKKVKIQILVNFYNLLVQNLIVGYLSRAISDNRINLSIIRYEYNVNTTRNA